MRRPTQYGLVGAALVVVASALGLPLTASADVAYACDRGGYVARIDISDGNVLLTKLSQPMGVSLPQGLAFARGSQTMYGVTGSGAQSDLFTVDLNTGIASVIGHIGSETQLSGLAFNEGDGFLYASSRDGRLLRVNPSTATPSLVGQLLRSDTGNVADVSGLDFNGGKLFGSGTSASGQGVKELYEINYATGTVTFLSTASPANFVDALSFAPSGGDPYGVQSYFPGPVSQLLRVDLVTGHTDVLADFTSIGLGNVSGMAFVPEPATLLLLALGGLALIRRRRK